MKRDSENFWMIHGRCARRRSTAGFKPGIEVDMKLQRVLLPSRPAVRTLLRHKADAGKMNGGGNVCRKSACEFIIFVYFVM